MEEQCKGAGRGSQENAHCFPVQVGRNKGQILKLLIMEAEAVGKLHVASGGRSLSS